MFCWLRFGATLLEVVFGRLRFAGWSVLCVCGLFAHFISFSCWFCFVMMVVFGLIAVWLLPFLWFCFVRLVCVAICVVGFTWRFVGLVCIVLWFRLWLGLFMRLRYCIWWVWWLRTFTLF